MNSSAHQADRQTEVVSVRKSRPLWPWVVGTLCVTAGAVVFSFWWPMHRANRVLHALEEQGAMFDIDFDHPDWSTYLLDEKTYHPWFDEVPFIDASKTTATAQLLDDLMLFHGLKELTIRVDDSPLEKFRQLESLETLWLIGRARPTDVRKSPVACFYRGERASFARLDCDDWKRLVTDLNVKRLWLECFDMHGCKSPNSNIERLVFSWCELDGSTGESISGLNSLKSLSLYDSVADPSFWEGFSQHPTLTELNLADTPVSGAGWRGLCRVEGLRELMLYFPWDVNKSTRPPEFDQLQPPWQPAGTWPEASAWQDLTHLTNLERLDVRNAPISEPFIRAFAKLPRLRSLALETVSVDADFLDELASSSSLEAFDIRSSSVEAAELRTFIEKHPRLEVTHDFSDLDAGNTRRRQQMIGN